MIRLIKSTFYNEAETKARLCEFITDAEILSMGVQCRDLEKAFAEKQQRKHAVYVTSGSAANLILVQSLLNLGLLNKGDKVAFSSLTWATNVMPLIELGLVPVPVDCDLSTLNITKETLSKLDLEDLKGLFITNVLGFSSNILEIKEFCDENGILFFEDNCESLGSKVHGKLLGNFGIASTFSTYVGHHISTIEGGFVCTDDDELYEMLLRVRAHGWDRNNSEEEKVRLREKHSVEDFYAKYAFYDLAYNTRPMEIQGFIGNQQIGFWDEIVSKRAENFKRFNEIVSKNPDILNLDLSHMDLVSNFAMPVVFRSRELCESYKKRFEEAKVEIRPIIAGDITKQPVYKKYYSEEYDLENSNIVHEQGFYFPNNPELNDVEVDLLCELITNKTSTELQVVPNGVSSEEVHPKMKKDSLIYISGHTGMVGSAVLRRFVQAGYTNIVLRTHDELDLLDQDKVVKFFSEVRPEFVINCAARVGGIKANSTYPADFLYENIQMQNNLIWASHKFGVKRFLFLGSSCSYPLDAPQPMKEEHLFSGKFVPSNEGYAVAKTSGIKFCEKIKNQYGKDFLSCMPTNVYGYNDNFDPEQSHVIPALLRKYHEAKVQGLPNVTAWGTGSPRREFLFVDDLADAILFIMENPSDHDLVNVGIGEDVTIKELTELIAQVVGYEGDIVWDTDKPDGAPRKLLDVSRLQGMGWRAGTSLEAGLKKTYEWFLENIAVE